MNDSGQIPVFGRDGQLGWIDPRGQILKGQNSLVRLDNGLTIQVPKDFLVEQEDGSFYLPMSKDQLQNMDQSAEDHLMVIPVLVEEAEIKKKHIERRVLIHKTVHEREEVIDEPGFREEIDIQHVPIGKVVDKAPVAHYEGKTLVIPLLEEVLVVEKRLVLKEEVRVTRRRETVRNPQKVTLRAEEVQVERPESEDNETIS